MYTDIIIMEKIFCPDKLDIDPNSLNAEKEFLHWRRTFDNFILECGERAPDKVPCFLVLPSMYLRLSLITC